MDKDLFRPNPLELFILVLFALSNEDLYIKFIPNNMQISSILPATSIACCLLSTTQGPDISVKGKLLPILFFPILTTVFFIIKPTLIF